eukprot:CAMPEP_0169481734 /NCGR_PEP_ID=MMETSP1042-20121227/30282_1 /TAXON_ID=464988 /ORGANISM="Hemiselmis andersenii, Strain CCMP1180" /LENGTH=43 /DNA_ID= /DNA_START= /DNA_END= /DNA_ORIENTATION=
MRVHSPMVRVVADSLEWEPHDVSGPPATELDRPPGCGVQVPSS